MTRRWTPDDIRCLSQDIQRQILANLAAQGPRSARAATNGRSEAKSAQAAPRSVRRTKYGSERVEFQGQRFDSRWELQCWRDLSAQQLAGAIRAVIRQVSLPLPGSTRRIRVDFLLVENDGRVRWLDAKGHETPAWCGKRQQVREAYGLDIELIRRTV